MGNFLSTQNMFSCGEVSPEFYATNNVRGLAKLENMDVLQSGGLKRRPGLKPVKTISGESILIPFIVNDTEKYLVLVRDSAIDIYSNDVKIKSLPTPWGISDFKKIQYAQRFNKLFFVHPNYKPRVVTRTTNNFNITTFVFKANSDASANMPFTRFEDTEAMSITISQSDIDNSHAVFTTSADFFTDASVGQVLLALSKQWIVQSVQNARVATVYTNGGYTLPNAPVYDWYECVFSDKRGWPACVSFHQNRLIFAGTPSAPNGIWMSKIGDYYNFDTGTGLDDDAIYTSLLAAQHHQICTVVSSDKLQILTSLGEWAISSSPLTPSSVSIKQHTSVGSNADIYLPPQQIEGSTVFVAKSGKDIRELDLDALGEKYNATDLCALSKHLMNNPISMAYSQQKHRLFIVMANGIMAVLNKYSGTDISAWGTYTTDGKFQYVCVFDDIVYVIVNRNGTYSLEKFDDTCLSDAGTYGFSYRVSAFPMIVNGHCPKKIRIRKVSLRVMNTKTLFINEQRIEIPNVVYTDDNPGYTRDLSVNMLGIQNETMKALWSLSSSEQLPATILSISIDGWYSI